MLLVWKVQLFIQHFFSTAEENTELATVFFLTYTLVLQNIGLQLSAFFARLPVNLFDKAFAVFVGLGIFIVGKKLFAKGELKKVN